MVVLEGGWKIDAEYLIGRRFRWTNGSPDVTFVSGKVDPPVMVGGNVIAHGAEHVHAHIFGGGKQWLPIEEVAAAIAAGILIEADGAPFVN